MSKSVVRTMKNVTKGYSSVQVKVRNATSNDSWGPSGTDMSEIAQMTFNNSGDFSDIMEMIDKRLNDKGKNWRHVLKSLKLLDYCLHEGSEMVVTWARQNIYVIKTLREFQYIDEEGRDVGQNVRTSAKELSSLIMDEDRLRAERHDRKLWKTRVTGLDDLPPPAAHAGSSGTPKRNKEDRRSRQTDEDDLEFRLAIEASKNEAEEDRRRRDRNTAPSVDSDDDLAKALKLSKEEEELRRKELEQNNAISLFDDAPAQPSQPQATGWNQGYQQQSAVDWFGNPVDQQQPQSTGFLNNAYAQPAGFQPQQTGLQNPYGYNPYQQPQQTGFDTSQYQQQQAQYLQPQQTSFNMNNPYSQQMGGFGDQSQQQPLEQQNTMQPGSHNPWASNSDGMDSLKAQPTGSNNPFAAQVSRPQQSQASRVPTLNTLQEQKTQAAFNSFQPQQTAQAPQNPHHAQLNALLASGEGQDTFGNVGNMRIPAQHTAPSTFVNSSGQGLNKLHMNQTGANPFLHNQFTGMPAQQTPMMSAQTGYGSSNPFGGQQPQQQRQGGQHQQSGSLIDL